VKEMEELREDIKMHLDLDTDSPINVEYWEVVFLSILKSINNDY
jgi:hypothetical protein